MPSIYADLDQPFQITNMQEWRHGESRWKDTHVTTSPGRKG